MDVATAELKNDNLMEKIKKLEHRIRTMEAAQRTMEDTVLNARQTLGEVINAVQEDGGSELMDKLSSIIYKAKEQ